MNSINYSLNLDGSNLFVKPMLPSDALFTEEAYIATWSGEDVLAANPFGSYYGEYAYSAVTIIPPADGNYDFTVTSATGLSHTDAARDADTQIWLYAGSFDPADPLTNLVFANEDINTFDDGDAVNLLSKLSSVALLGNTTYVLVVSSREAGLTGTAQVSFADAAPLTAPTPPSAGSPEDGNTAVDADKVVSGSVNNDTLAGGSGNDVFTPGLGHDMILGGAGTDTVRLAGYATDYKMKVVDGTLVVSAANGSTYDMSDIESLTFTSGQGSSPSEVSARLYKGILGREANAMEVDYWATQLRDGEPLKTIAGNFINSEEGIARFSASGSAGFVTALYESILDRTPGQAEVNYWLGDIAKGLDRADLALNFINSAEYLARPVALDLGNTDLGVLLRLYHTMFDRAPDEAGLNYWLGARAAGTSITDVAGSFANSLEAGNMDNYTFIDQIYHAGLNRDASGAEMAQLLDLFDRGLDRGQILLQISESPDAIALVGQVSSTVDLA